MAYINKIIKGLEDFIQCYTVAFDDGGEGPLIDTLTLLKAQQPRMLTVGEIRSLSGCPVWRETKNSRQKLYQGWVLLYEIQKGMGITGERFGMAEPNGHKSWYKIDDYGKTWRCWSARPTDEQRKAVAWSE